ncbi:myocardin-related transcription factor A-like [Halichoeres trimaculatus]|uniref:myocardin-related transcription factor A-like n=1 Tax=Halichoeres trimaculatus TaxID=147232 RepID=UPI003D9EAF9D
MSAILDHLPCVRTDPALHRTPPVNRNLDSRAVRFELERRACQSLRQVLQLKLRQKRSKEESVPSLETSVSCHDQSLSLEQTQTEDILKRMIRKRPETSTLETHVQDETSAEPLLQARHMQQKRARLADDLSDKISKHQPGSVELIHKNIQPVSCSSEQDITDSQVENLQSGNWSCEEDSSYSLSPEQSVNQEASFLLLPLNSPSAGGALSSTQIPGSSPSLKVTNRTAASPEQSACVTSQSKLQLKTNSDYSSQKEKKPKEDKPKVKKLKYHQYVPPDQRGAKEPPPHLDSSYAKIVQQQQLFLQLQIISQQKQSYHAILPAPAKPQTDQQLSPSSFSDSMTTFSSPLTVTASSTASSSHSGAPLAGIKMPSLPPNLDEMKVAELKSELKLRSLPVSGTKTDLIERLRSYQEVNGGSDTTSSLTAGGVTGLTTGGAGKSSKTAATTTIINNNKTSDQQQLQQELQPQRSAHSGSSDSTASSSSISVTLSSMSHEDSGFKCDQTKEMMGSPHTQLSLQACSAALFPANIKKEQTCFTSAPCQFSLKPACLQKHVPVLSTGSDMNDKAPAVTVDKDKMLKEKDKQIEELRRMLRQIQRVVELLKMQLERGKRERQVHESLVLVRVKQEPPDKPGDPLSHHVPFTHGMNVTKVKQESTEAEEVVSETTLQTPDAHGLTPSPTQTRQSQEQTHLRIQPEQMITQTKKHSHLRKTNLTVLQQQATRRDLGQHDSQKQMLQRKKKPHRELKQQQRQPSSAAKDIYQEPQWNLNQTHLSQDSTPTLVAYNNVNHFLTNHTDNQRTDTSENNTTNHIQLQEMCLSSDVLLSPVSPASIQTSKSSPHSKGLGQEENLIDSILQTRDTSEEHPNPSSSVQPESQTQADTMDEKQYISCGRLEDFLESTSGTPLLGVELGGGLTLIDDLHSQMLCSSSILDHPPSPMDVFDTAAKGEQELDGMDWLDLHVGGIKEEETVTLDPLGPQTPPSVFSTDFLDSIDLQIQWDSCL